jgi:hypothetical protein
MNTTPNQFVVPPENAAKLAETFDKISLWIKLVDLEYVERIHRRVYNVKNSDHEVVEHRRYDRVMNRSERRKLAHIRRNLVAAAKNPDNRRFVKLLNPNRRIVLGV